MALFGSVQTFKFVFIQLPRGVTEVGRFYLYLL